MSVATARAAAAWVRNNGLLGTQIEILWHAGEPLLAGLQFYRDAHKLIRAELPGSTSVEFAFQTNATLIDDSWAEFFAQTGSQIGVSIDGPQEWNDARRRNWGGNGSFDRVVRGVECLKRHNVRFSTVSVLSAQALADADRMYAFLAEFGGDTFGFNSEEREGNHMKSAQYETEAFRLDAENFYSVMYDNAARDGRFDRVREISKALRSMNHVGNLRTAARPLHKQIASELSDPFRIVNVSYDGRLSTFAPELLGQSVEGLGEFTFGNLIDDSLEDVIRSSRFRQALEQIRAGVEKCQNSCQYYQFCGGGSPSNKYFENGSFASTETAFCQLSIMAPVDAVLAKLEHESAVRRK